MLNIKMKNPIQTYLPNSITFLSLGTGLISIMLSSRGFMAPAALCILFSVFLDSLDGFLARKLNAASSFGKQLDSLVDIVSFGVAPIFLVWQYIGVDQLSNLWIVPILVLQIIASAFRLSRFNLQTTKQSNNHDTMGLTITQTGLVLSLVVLSDISIAAYSLPIWIFALLSLFLSYLMISNMLFRWHQPSKLKFLLYLLLGAGLVHVSSPFTVLLILYLCDLAFSISRSIFIFSESI